MTPVKTPTNCLDCAHFTPCACKFQRDKKGRCAADDGQTVYVASNRNCTDYEQREEVRP
jgi:hypothetical protein